MFFIDNKINRPGSGMFFRDPGKIISIDVYKRQAYNGTIAETADGASTDITFEPVDASDVKVTVVKSYDNPEGKYASAGEINVYSATKEAVSYTHLDVYKRQAEGIPDG